MLQWIQSLQTFKAHTNQPTNQRRRKNTLRKKTRKKTYNVPRNITAANSKKCRRIPKVWEVWEKVSLTIYLSSGTSSIKERIRGKCASR
jgi:hypothetical protein